MKKIFLLALGVLWVTSLCFAQDYYALVEVLIKNDAGTAFIMNTITKVPDQNACEKILAPVNLLKDRYQIRTECVSGPKWEQLFGPTFANQPTSALYISYKDPNGYETRINTKVLVGSKSSASTLPADLAIKDTIVWANAMITALKKGGINNPRIIYPRAK